MVDYTSEKLKHLAIGSIVAVLALAIIATSILSSVTNEGLDITESSIKKGATTQSILTLTVKNIGNSPITNINGAVIGLPSGVPFSFVINSGTLDVGAIMSHVVEIPNSSALSTGASYPLSINATSSTGLNLVKTGLAYVSRI